MSDRWQCAKCFNEVVKQQKCTKCGYHLSELITESEQKAIEKEKRNRELINHIINNTKSW